MSAHSEKILYEAVHGCEALHLGSRLEAPHLTLPLACRLMGNFGSIVGVLVRGVDDGRHHGPASRRVPGKVVATLMGHAKVDTTLNVYTQVLDGALRGAAEKVGSELITIDHKSRGTSELTPQDA